ncbi:hypothetical protein H8L32_09765 [Undibacterium sp. CY18W]|uniref:Uncharacterized protein n=1 Tax=Undibacterium hunanense TaxID=2762292 RepID=A0ABR6ZPH5_9BURK|nr:hypothetical protein [Undibacterium hunanense]MBC3917758.1 hypothetical protein [Undibacterium hunanense]
MQALYYREEIASTGWMKALQSRWQMLVAVTLAHLLLIALWPSVRMHKSDSFISQALWVKMLEVPAPAKSRQAEPALVPAPAPIHKLPLPARASPVRPVPAVQTPVAAVAASPEVSPAAQTNEPLSQAITPELAGENSVILQRDIRSIIKAVEREMPNRILTDIRPEKSSMVAFAINVAAAARPRGTSYKNIVMADGTAMTKVTTSAGSYCVIGAKPGADISKAPGIRTVSCGSY